MKISRTKFVTEWIKDLRSGKYRQTKQYLTAGNGRNYYCCLGVACKTGERLGIKEASFKNPEHRREEGELPGKWFYRIFRSNNPVLIKSREIGFSGDTCSSLNDDKNMSFKEIADLLEKKYLKK